MLVITTIAGARSRRRELWRQGRTVALVPTMGALHAGHLALLDRARERADEVWATVFVNPEQFGPGEDFERYPRDLERDRELLEQRGVALLFAPAVKELYPRPPATRVDVPALVSGLCGAHRPGHFAGVALVVTKLLNITQPEVAVFGAKDYQQAQVIRRAVADLDIPVRIEVVPTVRELDGLALSSRNAYLDEAQRRAATVLAHALERAAEAFVAGEREGPALERILADEVAGEPLAALQYAAAVDPETLLPLGSPAHRALLALAVTVGATRLIDNRLVEV
jgi:pantoate--beta-alanine ligase